MDLGSVQATARLLVAEVFALIIGVSSMRAAGTLPFSSIADAGLAKIEKALPSDKLRDLRRLSDCLCVRPLAPQVETANMGEMETALLPAFEQSFVGPLHLSFQYRDAKGAKTAQQIEPQALLILPPLWCLVALDPTREGFRHFRMDRISRPEVVEGSTFRSWHVPFDDGMQPLRYA